MCFRGTNAVLETRGGGSYCSTTPNPLSPLWQTPSLFYGTLGSPRAKGMGVTTNSNRLTVQHLLMVSTRSNAVHFPTESAPKAARSAFRAVSRKVFFLLVLDGPDTGQLNVCSLWHS